MVKLFIEEYDRLCHDAVTSDPPCSGDKFDWIRDVNAFNYDTSIYLGIQTHLSFHN